MKPVLSIIVPAFNVENYIEECITSILKQSFTNFELLLIDDGSTDNSGKICDEYALKDNRVRVFHGANRGVSFSRNLGIANSKGELIMYVDGDDFIADSMCEKLVGAIEESDADIAFCDYQFALDDHVEPSKSYDWHQQGIEGLKEYIEDVWTTVWGNVHRKSLYDNDISSPEGVRYCEDFHLMVRLCSNARKVAKVAEPLYSYRQRTDSMVHNISLAAQKDERWVYQDIIEYLQHIGVYTHLEKQMCWRTLKAAQELALSTDRFNDFLAYNPDKAKYILSCPYIGVKLKIIMWLLTHNMKHLASLIVSARKALGR